MKYQVLVVDNMNFDIPHYRSMAVFAECGYEISAHTSDLNKAATAAVNRDYDMFLCINRPTAVIAVNLLKRLQKLGANIPTVVISKVDYPKDMRECFLLGAVDYLTEPIMEEDIRASLYRVAQEIGRKIMNEEYLKAMESALAKIPEKSGSDPFRQRLRDLLIDAQGSALSVEAASDFFGLNTDYFSRCFKGRTGMSFGKFYKSLSIDYARMLLSSGHYKVNEVSDILGYASADYFSKVFKRMTGELPSQVKR
ncbi:MAG: response regulator transcription factor [Ruminococcus sp.]|nr:response regulator transcription factor [Ruminococcus sp.]